jgi:hypothetical protein
MRAGPLSDEKVISLLNRYFVPVYVVNEDYEKNGSAPPEEKAERNRIWREALQAKLPSGTVHVYVLHPSDAKVFNSMHVARAAETPRLVAMLEDAIAKLNVPEGKPVVKVVPQSAAPEAAPDALVLHLTARGFNKGSWREFPSENWMTFSRDEWAKFTGKAEVGSSWEIDKDVAAKLLTHFYPQTENNDVSTNRIDQQSLKATVISVKNGVARARVDGSLKMKHTFYPNRDDNNFVDATVVGYVDFEPGKRIQSLRIVTDRAIYGKEGFGVAAQSLP